MKIDAIVFRGAGGRDVLQLQKRQLRPAASGEVLVRVLASGLNRADILQRRGFYPAPEGAPADIPGLEFVGRALSGEMAGQRVMGIVSAAAMASHLLTRDDHLLPVPENLSDEQAAAIPEAYMTAFDAIEQVALNEPSKVLVHAGGSGVGMALCQLLCQAGHGVVATTRSAGKIDVLREFGAEPWRWPPTAEALSAKKASFSAIFDCVGAAYSAQSQGLLGKRGTWLIYGLLGGANAELNLGALLAKRARIVGTVLRSRDDGEKAGLAARFGELVIPLIESGAIVPRVDRVFAAHDIAEAHRCMEENENIGKIVLSWKV